MFEVKILVNELRVVNVVSPINDSEIQLKII